MDFSTLYSLTRLTEQNRGKIDNKETQRILDFYDRITVNTAKDVVSRWRRDVDYLKAIRELESGS